MEPHTYTHTDNDEQTMTYYTIYNDDDDDYDHHPKMCVSFIYSTWATFTDEKGSHNVHIVQMDQSFNVEMKEKKISASHKVNG